VTDLRDHLDLFAAGACTPTVGVTIAASFLSDPPSGRVLVEIPEGYVLSAAGAHGLAERLSEAAVGLDVIERAG
jgi:hypothetical protein